MSLKTRLVLLLDRLLDLLPGDRNSPGSLEARTRKAIEKQTAMIVASSQHVDAVVKNAEGKAEAQLQAAVTTARSLLERIDALHKHGLLKQTEAFAKAQLGLALACDHEDLYVKIN